MEWKKGNVMHHAPYSAKIRLDEIYNYAVTIRRESEAEYQRFVAELMLRLAQVETDHISCDKAPLCGDANAVCTREFSPIWTRRELLIETSSATCPRCFRIALSAIASND